MEESAPGAPPLTALQLRCSTEVAQGSAGVGSDLQPAMVGSSPHPRRRRAAVPPTPTAAMTHRTDAEEPSGPWPDDVAEIVDWVNRLSDGELELVRVWTDGRRPTVSRRASTAVRSYCDRISAEERLLRLHAGDQKAEWAALTASAKQLTRVLYSALVELHTTDSGTCLGLVRDLQVLVEHARRASVPLSTLTPLAATWEQGPAALIDAAVTLA